MNPTETADILRQFNEWRRGDETIEQPDPREIGEAIDAAVEMIDRLEAAESDALEQARLNGLGSEREAALMAKLEAAEKERDSLRADKATLQQMTYSLKDRLEVAEKAVTEAYRRGYETGQEEVEKERDDVAQQLVQSEIGKRKISEERDALQAEVGKLKDLEVSRCVKINEYIVDNARLAEEVERLRAKIAEMEKQEPVGVLHVGSYYGEELQDWEFEADQRVCDHLNERHVSNPTSLNLYALPSAQSAPSVPEGWQLVPTAESRHPGIYKMLGALHDADNTPGMSEWESYRAMLAAAPEAKP